MEREIKSGHKEQLVAPAIVRLVRAEQLLAEMRTFPLSEWPDTLEKIQHQLMLAVGAVEGIRVAVKMIMESNPE